jgi:hypothetical protein
MPLLPTTNDAHRHTHFPPELITYTHILALSVADAHRQIYPIDPPARSSAAPVLVGLASQLQRDETPRQASSIISAIECRLTLVT